ncbi:histidine phosphatase superfamily [Chytridium lagenaria]|nr:histidine phosphatase superfamily [Chytridium lagenaria]
MVFPPRTPTPSESIKVKRLYLIRHGETDANASGILQGRGIDLDLSVHGRKQAEALAERFRDVVVDSIIVTSLKRTAETASYIQKYHPNTFYKRVAGLDEISWGKWEGGPLNAELEGLWKAWENGSFDAKAPLGESPFDVEDRCDPEIYDILQRDESDVVLVVHGRLLRILLASLLFQDLRYMPDFKHHNTCVNIVDVAISSDLKDAEALQAFSEGGCVQRKYEKGQSTTFPLCSSKVKHPDGIAFRAVVLNDTEHLSTLKTKEALN